MTRLRLAADRRAIGPLLLLLLAAPAALAQTTTQGVYSAAQAQRGEALYAENCEHCHLADLQGAEFMAPAIGGRAFGAKWTGKTLGEAFEYIGKNMPLDAPGQLDAREYADIVAYLLKYSRYPAGAGDLPADAKALAAIKVEAPPP